MWVFIKSKVKPEKFSAEIWQDLPFNDHYPSHLASKRLQVEVPAGPLWPAQKLQVMFVHDTIKDIYALLSMFDVSCHAWARNKEGFLVKHPQATLPGKPVVWLNKPSTSDIDVDYLCTKGTCVECDESWAELAAQAAAPKLPSRLEKFTARYANTTIDDLWL
jgi:hypothetical protein